MVSREAIDLEERIRSALIKDQGERGDVTSLALVGPKQQARAELVVKDGRGVISGLMVFELVFRVVDPTLKVDLKAEDGDCVESREVVATIDGNARSILLGERVALEFVRRMSGIATKTAEFVREVKGTKTQVLDTRKILPGWGELDKQAVRDGGGSNHRKNLSEMGLIKNNHLDLMGGDIGRAVGLFRKKYPRIALEVEVRNGQELLQALRHRPERIMLDNMNDEQIAGAVKIRDQFAAESGLRRIPLEASGNMTLERVRRVADCGVEYISVGMLTHSVTPLDISLHISVSR